MRTLHPFFSIKILIIFIIGILIYFIVNLACEKHNDPFSSLNSAPEIQEFSFENDSLKFTKIQPFDVLYLKLKYSDKERQQLTATFNFLKGKGTIFHTLFQEINKNGNSIIFDAPSVFNSDEDGKISFIPDTTGLVEIELVLADKVKQTEKNSAAYLYNNLNPVAQFSYKLLTNVSPYELEVDASKSYDQDKGKIKWYYWSFDDGSPIVKTGSNTYRYKYQFSGTYTVQLKVEDNESGIDSTEKAIATNNQSPLAILQVEPASGKAPLTINYTATNSVDPDGRIVSYRIDFDDGTSSLDSIGTHVYSIDNNYQVNLKIQDNFGQTDTTGLTVKVSTPPVAILKIDPIDGAFPLECTIDATESYDPQGGKVEQDIYIDGKLQYDNTESVNHTFETAGNHLVRLQVTNKRNNLTAEAQQFVNVTSLPPVAILKLTPSEGPFPLNCLIDGTASYDPKGGNLEHDIYIGGKLEYDNVDSVTHTFTSAGSYLVRLVVKSDLTNLSAENQKFVNVTSVYPVADLKITPREGPFPLNCLFDATASYDPLGGELEYDIYIDGQLQYENMASVNHVFENPEKYLVRLVVTSKKNALTNAVQQTVSVNNLNPRADFTWSPASPQHMTPVTYTSTSIDSNSADEISYYKWTFPFGKIEEGQTKNTVIHTFDAGVDTFRVKLEVWDKFKDTKFEGYSSITKIIK